MPRARNAGTIASHPHTYPTPRTTTAGSAMSVVGTQAVNASLTTHTVPCEPDAGNVGWRGRCAPIIERVPE